MRQFWCSVIMLIIMLMLHVLLVHTKENHQQQLYQENGKSKQSAYFENEVNFDQITTLSSLTIDAFECLHNASLTHCLKLYLLQRMERSTPVKWQREHKYNLINIQQDLMYQLFGDELLPAKQQKPLLQSQQRLIEIKYMMMSESELNNRLHRQFERFFAHRELKLAHLLPGLMVKVITSKNGKLQFSLKQNSAEAKKHKKEKEARAIKSDEIDEKLNDDTLDDASMMMVGDMQGSMKKPGGNSGGGILKKKNKSGSYKSTILQMAVPVMVMPAIIMGSLLPFILPVLKIATVMTLLMNNSAFLASLIYAARTHASAQEEQHITYTHPAYHQT